MANKRFNQLTRVVTSFDSNDVLPIGNGTLGDGQMPKDALLQETAQNALVDNLAEEFIDNTTQAVKDKFYIHAGSLYRASENYLGVWDNSKFKSVNACEFISYLLEYSNKFGFFTAGNSVDFVISDKQGNALSIFSDGGIRTKNFDSADLNREITKADYVIADNKRNAIVVFEDGHIKTKNFDSSDTFSKKDTENSDFVIADGDKNAIAVFKDGHIKTKNFDSAHIATEWNIDFTGKKFCFIGDSITDESVYTSYVSLLAERTGATCVNLGQSGDSIGGRAGAHYGHFKDRATAANLQGADLVCVFGGTNDFDRATYPIGPLFKEIQNTPWQYSTGVAYGVPDNTGAFGGAVHELILTIRQNCPATPIMFITPLNRGEYSDNRPTSKEQNEHGDTMQDFRHAIEVICNFYAIPVFKAHQNPQFDFTDAATAAMYSRDNLHPNLLGQTILERQLEKWIYLNINLL